MKRFAAFILVLLAAAMLFASTEFTFSGTYALIGANGRTIRRTTTEIKDGIFIATGNAPVAADSKQYTIFLRDNSLLALTEDESSTVAYLVYGVASFVVDQDLEKPIHIYTPTTLVTISEQGEYCVISTDDNEILFNFSTLKLDAYDAIRGAKITVREAEGFDYIHKTRVNLDYSYKMTEGEMEEIIRIPAAPVFTSPLQSVVDHIPSMPQFASVEQKLLDTPQSPEFSSVDQKLLDAPQTPEFTSVEQKLLDTPAAPSFSSIAQNLMKSAPEAPVLGVSKQEVVSTPVKDVTIIVTQTLEDDGQN